MRTGILARVVRTVLGRTIRLAGFDIPLSSVVEKVAGVAAAIFGGDFPGGHGARCY